MIPLIVRVLKRLLVLAVGFGLVYAAVWRVFPFFDHRLPWAAALFATYVAMAYAIVPALFRAMRFFFRPNHIPHYCVTPDGFASDPINIGLIGTRHQVISAMKKAGWQMADRHSIINVVRAGFSALLRQPYPSAPMSSLFLFGRKQDLGFEVQIDEGRGKRHHVRFWACEVEAPEEFNHHVKFWQRLHRPQRKSPNRQLWVGAASKDSGFAPIRHNAQVTHMVDPNTNVERDLIVHNLRKAGQLANTRVVIIDKPYRVQNRAWRGFLNSDGRVTICELTD